MPLQIVLCCLLCCCIVLQSHNPTSTKQFLNLSVRFGSWPVDLEGKQPLRVCTKSVILHFVLKKYLLSKVSFEFQSK